MFELTINIALVRASDDDDEDEKRTVAEKDSFVSMGTPESNYGNREDFVVGDWFEPNEAYLYFEFEDEPEYWKEAEISLNFYTVFETLTIEIYLIKAIWDENTITWANKPVKSKLIRIITVVRAGIYSFDVTDEVEDLLDDDEEGISICIHHSDNATNSGYLQGMSREGYIVKDDAPLLIWTYEETGNVQIDILLTVIILLIILGVAGLSIVGFFVLEKRKMMIGEPISPES